MEKTTKFAVIISLLALLSACQMPSGGQVPVSQTSTSSPAASTAVPPTAIPPTETPDALVVEPPAPDSVALDFVVDYCSAEWSNNAEYLPCPGNLDDIDGGYIEASDHALLEGMVSVDAPLLIGLPGKGYPAGVGLFGHYPPFTVYPGDTFQAIIACQEGTDCSLNFSLEYFDQWGNYQDTSWEWAHQSGDGPQEISADLSPLAGQTVDFALVLRAEDELADQWGIWIQPYIAREPGAQPLPTVEILPTTVPDEDDQTPGVISGMVDMSSAPPYLTDPMSGSSSPVAVVFFNLSDGTYWWIHTSLTGHPYYQMTVTPGEYQVVAYAQGVGDLPYVAGGYTGKDPSCGNGLKTVTMTPNGRVENIVIADWNWSCGGTAYRPPKPSGVPLP